MVGGIPILPNCQSLTVGGYDALTAGWAPPPGAPAEWAELAASCGVDYAVLTTKHHDGFTLFPSDFSEHGIHMSAPGRDLVDEFVTAMRMAGIRVGLYFSLPDWHHRCYPAFTDEMRPYPALGYPRPAPEEWERFLADQRGQIGELLTRYGTIDLLWFDGGWERTAEEWRSDELKAFIFERQPRIVTNDRCPGLSGYSSMLYEGVVPFDGGSEPWEACVPLDDSWGPLDHDSGRKSTREVVGLLADAAAGGGRLLLNLAPLGGGSLMDWQRERLEGLARWLARNGEAISGTRPAGLRPGQFYGPVTRSGNRYFLICPMRPEGLTVLRAVRGRRVTGARLLGAGTPVEFSLRISAFERMISADPLCDVLFHVGGAASADLVTVIELETSGELA
jgi:alpha-L-fucosidase